MSPAEKSKNSRSATLGFAALLLGGAALGLSPIFVRLSDVGPTASAFWRLAVGLPMLWARGLTNERSSAAGRLALVRPRFARGDFLRCRSWRVALVDRLHDGGEFDASGQPRAHLRHAWRLAALWRARVGIVHHGHGDGAHWHGLARPAEPVVR